MISDDRPRPEHRDDDPPADAGDGPPEVVDAARQEAEFPEDTTDEG